MNQKISKMMVLKPYNLKDLQGLYGISSYVLVNWIKPFKDELGKPSGRLYNLNQVRLIFQKLGVPGQEIEIN